MTKPKNALMKQYKFQFGIDDVEIHVTDAAMRAVAQTAIKKGTGARGLRSIMEAILLDVSRLRQRVCINVCWRGGGGLCVCRVRVFPGKSVDESTDVPRSHAFGDDFALLDVDQLLCI